MDATGNTHTMITVRNSFDALDFVSAGDAVDIEGVRLLCVIIRRARCEHRIRRAESFLIAKLSNARNLSFVKAIPGGGDILMRIGAQ
jgi:hypothetical protein